MIAFYIAVAWGAGRRSREREIEQQSRETRLLTAGSLCSLPLAHVTFPKSYRQQITEITSAYHVEPGLPALAHLTIFF